MQPAEAERLARAICSADGLAFVGPLGSGTFKHAFCVEGTGSVRRALKVYKSLAAAQDARTLREIAAITRCDHPGIVKFEGLKVWDDGGVKYAYSFEEYVDGGSLEQRLVAGPLTPTQVKQEGTALVEILMFRKSGELVVVDFGLVRDLSAASLTHTWAPQGPCSPFFAAPEQLNNQKDLIDWRTDQFAVGVVLCLAATGVHPFATSGDGYETVSNVQQRRPPTPAFVGWANGTGLTCLPGMVSTWPVHRYRTPADLMAAWAAQRVP